MHDAPLAPQQAQRAGRSHTARPGLAQPGTGPGASTCSHALSCDPLHCRRRSMHPRREVPEPGRPPAARPLPPAPLQQSPFLRAPGVLTYMYPPARQLLMRQPTYDEIVIGCCPPPNLHINGRTHLLGWRCRVRLHGACPVPGGSQRLAQSVLPHNAAGLPWAPAWAPGAFQTEQLCRGCAASIVCLLLVVSYAPALWRRGPGGASIPVEGPAPRPPVSPAVHVGSGNACPHIALSFMQVL